MSKDAAADAAADQQQQRQQHQMLKLKLLSLTILMLLSLTHLFWTQLFFHIFISIKHKHDKVFFFRGLILLLIAILKLWLPFFF